MGFTRDDLKTGMICLHRNGEYSMVVKDTYEKKDNVIFHCNNRTDLDGFDNITFKWYSICSTKEIQTPFEKTVDIVKVFKPYNICNGAIIFSAKDYEKIKNEVFKWEIVWEENQTEDMTLEQICKALGKNIRIVG